MSIEKPDYKKVKEKVQEILDQNSIIEPPISPREIAANYGIEIDFVTFRTHKEISGFFNFDENKIYINHEEPYNRNNFSIAHELGHYFLHKPLFEKYPDKYNVLLRAPMGAITDPIEQEANAFAGHLLVPRKMLDKYYKYASVEDLAELFIVSKEVIRNRLKFEYGY